VALSLNEVLTTINPDVLRELMGQYSAHEKAQLWSELMEAQMPMRPLSISELKDRR
jgi:hypothetical protein